jgi:F0F1-type ATP synthase assembly protein I
MPEDGDEPVEIEPTGMPDGPRRSDLDDLLDESRPRAELPDPPQWEYERQKEADEPLNPQSIGAQKDVSRGMGLAFAIGSSFLGPVLAGLLIGYLIDGKAGGAAGTIGLLIGTVVAFVLLIRLVNKLNENG